jgi:hypothetical protein
VEETLAENNRKPKPAHLYLKGADMRRKKQDRRFVYRYRRQSQINCNERLNKDMRLALSELANPSLQSETLSS